ncbi:hypothetical protein GGS26DRAFT_598659 [Hypomontagnella submonticulosa]|nr:hypothetical protein GGS26DRAFT_598659 [Hypomontagnella submonticulosa]
MSKLADEPIAIIGTSCRYPGGASSPSKLWDLLVEPRDLVKKIPESRFGCEPFYNTNPSHHGSFSTKRAYFMEEDPRLFDNTFFGISSKEAQSMDPQQRLLLESVYEGVESAGYSIPRLRGSDTAVFVGRSSGDYGSMMGQDLEGYHPYGLTGTAASILANRVSYFFDWKGPSLALDTACSSGLLALHLAVQSLRAGEARVAVVAATNMLLGPEAFIGLGQLHMLSPTGKSYMWDASADGFTRGEGIAAMILKPLSQALADNDHIESIVRNTGTNQDGRTRGITLPSAEAQTELIQSTYAKCGLDLTNPEGRPQFFEAHGTGTPAGDPLEAEAIYRAIFPESKGVDKVKLHVGSIKTVIGHLEAGSGIAGVLKATLAVQHGRIPPNLHFSKLNPAIDPFYDAFRVPTAPTPWPALAPGVPRRVSVNSFGFGGANVHAIIEQCPPGSRKIIPSPHVSGVYEDGAGLPVLLSAGSSRSLASMVAELGEHLQTHTDIKLADLAYTLSRRGDFPYRASFSAISTAQLAEKLRNSTGLSNASRAHAISERLPLRILGVFNGQGAQWPTMGRELYMTCSLFRDTINKMQRSLDDLPDGPDWSLGDQLCAPAARSRVQEPAVSQPLCTALQIALTELLRAADITFSAVVSHSSGEVAAAYAAGYLSMSDAIRVSYHRGRHTMTARGPGGIPGKMIAVGLSLEQAAELCGEIGADRICVAANNSARSCTLSGDADAVDEAQQRLDAQGTFARTLKVDAAYHSPHMLACAAPYLASLRECGVVVQDGPYNCKWYSSVYGADGRSRSFEIDGQLEGQYWVDNMTHPVLFAQAVRRAITEEHVHDLVLEIGPHPALKGPASEIIKSITSCEMPYSGVLKRGQNALESFADAMGFIWTRFTCPKPLFDFNTLQSAFRGNAMPAPVLLKGLPSYSWDHGTAFWHESRRSKAYRIRSAPPHMLLGHGTSYGEGRKWEVRWRHIFKLDEMVWPREHRFQGQVIVPGASYVSMAYEASVHLAADLNVSARLVELKGIQIHRAISLEENSPGTEVEFVIRTTSTSNDCISAEYACYSAPAEAVVSDARLIGGRVNFTGRVDIILGDSSPDALPSRIPPQLPMQNVNVKELYPEVRKITGVEHYGDFCFVGLERRHNQATVKCKSIHSGLRIHPATLDQAVQGIFMAFSFPGDGRLWTTYLPSSISLVRVNMSACPHEDSEDFMTADAFLTASDTKSFTGDVDIFCEGHGHPQMQVRGLRCASFIQAGQKSWNDRALYAKHEFVRDVSSGIEPSQHAVVDSKKRALLEIIDRAAYFYLRRLKFELHTDEMPSMEWNFRHLVTWVLEHLLPEVEAGESELAQKDWNDDTEDMVQTWGEEHSESVDLQAILTVGQDLVRILRRETPPLQVWNQNDLHNRFYHESSIINDTNHDLFVLAGQLSHRYPHMRVLEVGAGTGGSTRGVLAALEGRMGSYTFTDISPSFFQKARKDFDKYSGRMIFKTLDIEEDPSTQGYELGSYDLIIASNVLHATRRLSNTLRQCRALLRPGGHLLLMEGTRMTTAFQLLFGVLPGWFLGLDDNRVWAPSTTIPEWNDVLKKVGFSGVDTSVTPYCSVMVSQAVDNTVQTIRDPFDPKEPLPQLDELLILRDTKPSSRGARLSETVEELVGHLFGNIKRVTYPEEYLYEADITTSNNTAVLCLTDLDAPIFDGINEQRHRGLQNIVQNAKAALWVVSGADADPYVNMSVGWARTVWLENPDIKFQLVDIDGDEAVDSKDIATALLRLVCLGTPQAAEVLWSTEPEVALRNGALYIPRLLPKPKNAEFNGTQNKVHQNGNHQNGVHRNGILEESLPLTVELVESGDGVPSLQPVPQRLTSDNGTLVQVLASSAQPLVTSDGQSTYLCVGNVLDTGKKAIALSPINASAVCASEQDIFPSSPEDPCQLLHQLLVSLLSEDVVSKSSGPIWVHGADSTWSRAIQQAAHRQGVELYLGTSDEGIASKKVKFIHPYITQNALWQSWPRGVKAFANLQQGRRRPVDEAISKLIRTANIPNISPEMVKDGSSPTGSSGLALSVNAQQLRQNLKRHLDMVTDPASDYNDTYVLPIEKVGDTITNTPRPDKIIDWRTLDVAMRNVHSHEQPGLFSPNKTYLLFGLAGDVGNSICLWMVEHGARYIVTSSRSPKTSASVVEYLANKGATIRVVSLDVTNREALNAIVDDVKSTMPPVGGVMHGAMVLRDRLFLNQSWSDFAAILAPKMEGARNLDEIFGPESNLDFFILLSSATCILGNSGQAAYTAANMYNTGLAARRRRHGMAASVIHISELVGLGYWHRAKGDRPWDLGFMKLSETDLHDTLADAIRVGQPSSGESLELICNFRTGTATIWKDNPRLWYYFTPEDDKLLANSGGNNGEQNNKHDGKSVKDLLDAAEDSTALQTTLENCFARELHYMLQVDAGRIDKDMPVAGLGVDSLVAVQIRSWFLKEVGVEIPVLKILADSSSFTQLCRDALAGRRRSPATKGVNGGDKVQDGDEIQNGAREKIAEADIDWDKEIESLLAEVEGLISSKPKLNGANGTNGSANGHINGHANGHDSGLVVVLTGATGFLGKHILQKLVHDDRVREVHCIAIRPGPDGTPRHVEVQHPKVIEYIGDLASPLAGLSQASFGKLSQHADLIFHTAFEVNFLKSYNSVRPTNVASMPTLLAMAAPHAVPLQFVSSNIVAMLQASGELEIAEVSSGHLRPSKDLNRDNRTRVGYAAGKWVCEALLERFSARVPAVVHRPSPMVGEGGSEPALMRTVDEYSKKIGALPSLDAKLWPGRLDQIEVEDVARDIVEAALESRLGGTKKAPPFAVRNHCTDDAFEVANMQKVFKARQNLELDVWPIEKWLKKATEMGMDRTLDFIMRSTVESKVAFPLTSLRKGVT